MTYPAFPTLDGDVCAAIAPGSSSTARPAVLTAGFGGRYSQRTGNGINALPRDFAFRSKPLNAAQAKVLDDFLIGRKGYLPFTFHVPRESAPRQFICSQWTLNYDTPAHRTLTATFEENFDP